MAKNICSKKSLVSLRRHLNFLGKKNIPKDEIPNIIITSNLDIIKLVIINNKAIFCKSKEKIINKNYSISFKEMELKPYYSKIKYIFILEIIDEISIFESTMFCEHGDELFLIIPAFKHDINNLLF